MNWMIDDKKNKAAQRSFFVELNDTEKQICQLLQSSSGEHIDVISFQMKIPVSAVNVQLFHLEMKGLIKSLPGKKYCMI